MRHQNLPAVALLLGVRHLGHSASSWPQFSRGIDPLLIQGFYFLLTGIWPLVDRRSFEKVTGPKTDFWLVQTLGALIAVVGGVLATRNSTTDDPSMRRLAIGSAAALALADAVFAGRGRISKIYLLDAGIEMILAGCVALRRGR
jgi:hypothetical protein